MNYLEFPWQIHKQKEMFAVHIIHFFQTWSTFKREIFLYGGVFIIYYYKAKKKKCVFTVTRPTLIFASDPMHFYTEFG